MKFKTWCILLFLQICSISTLFGQDDFVVGMFCFEWSLTPQDKIMTSKFNLGKNSSSLNVLAQDGFNIVQQYRPDWWSSDEYTTNLVTLVRNNGLKILVNAMHYYWPGHPNEYDNTTGARPNYFKFIDNIYSRPSLSNSVWGHQLTEEASYYQLFNPSNNPPRRYGSPYLENFEVPPLNVDQAIFDFRTRLKMRNIGHQNLIIMEAAHHKAIGELAPYDKEGDFIPSDYLKLKNKPDVFFDGSYKDFVYPYKPQDYSNIKKGESHYLGFLKTIDYAYQFVGNVHKVINIEGEYKNVLHYNTLIPNANWLWFQSYSSIIHGVKGLWFFQLNKSWAPEEKPIGWDTDIRRFERNNFSSYYKDYVSYLAQELSYLKKMDLLQVADSSIICSKTDHVDNYDVLPKNKRYLPLDYRSNSYDLRYTFRTNGNEALLIIANPLPFHIDVVEIDLSKVPNHIIRHSNNLELLFNNSNLIYHSKYKTNRNSNILTSDLGELKKMKLEIDSCTKKFKLHFAPIDVHIIKIGNINLSGWQENATAGFFVNKKSDIAVEDFKSNQRKIFYVDEDNYIRLTYKTEHSWKNTTLRSVPKVRRNSVLKINEKGELFYISDNHNMIKLIWEKDKWIFEKLSDFKIPESSNFSIADLDKIYTLNNRNQLVILYQNNSSWERATLNLVPKALGNTKLYWNRDEKDLYYISDDGVICRIYWDKEFWNYEKTSGIVKNHNSKILVKDKKVYYVGDDGIIRFTYLDTETGEWDNSWFPDYPKAKLNSDIQWNDDDNGIIYISDDNLIHCIYWDAQWNYKVISQECSEPAANILMYYNSRISYLGIDGKIHEYTNYDKLPLSRNILSIDSDIKEIYQERKEINIYPNPAKDLVYFDCETPNANVIIKNQLGKVIIDKKLENNIINLSQLPRGLYFTIIQDGAEYYIQKLILE